MRCHWNPPGSWAERYRPGLGWLRTALLLCAVPAQLSFPSSAIDAWDKRDGGIHTINLTARLKGAKMARGRGAKSRVYRRGRCYAPSRQTPRACAKPSPPHGSRRVKRRAENNEVGELRAVHPGKVLNGDLGVMRYTYNPSAILVCRSGPTRLNPNSRATDLTRSSS